MSSQDKRSTYSTSPGRSFVAVTPHDTNDIQETQALNVSTAGTLSVIGAGDDSAVTIYVTQGMNAVSVTRVLTGGTASGIVAVYPA